MTNEELIAELRQTDPETSAAGNILTALWEQNAGLVRQTVHRMTGLNYHDPDFLDMEQQAYFGLHAAAYAFDPSGTWKFSTYAVKRIEWELSRYYAGNGYTKIPAYMRRRMKDALRRKREREQAEGRRVPLESVLADMGLSSQEVQTTLAAYRMSEVQSIDAPAPGTDDLTIGDTIAAEDSVEGAGMGQEWHRELHSTLRLALQEVPAVARGVIVRHYYNGISLTKQAEETGLTLEALRQREHRAFRKIRRGKHAAAPAEFASTESERQRMAWLIEREREAFELIDLSERERGLLL